MLRNIIPWVQESGSKRAVSPVIGVILMVAITVILAAVIGTFVLGLGDKVSESAPQASINAEDAGQSASSISEDGSATLLTVEHKGGDKIQGSETTYKLSHSGSSAELGDSNLTATVDPGGDGSATATAQIGFVGGTSSKPSEYQTADSFNIAGRIPADGGTGGEGDATTGESASLTGKYTLTIIDQASGQIVAEKNVDVS